MYDIVSLYTVHNCTFRYASVIDHSVDYVDHLTVDWKD